MSRALTLYHALNRLPNLDLHPTLNLCGEVTACLAPQSKIDGHYAGARIDKEGDDQSSHSKDFQYIRQICPIYWKSLMA